VEDIIGEILIFGILPLVVFGYLYLTKRSKNNLEIEKQKRAILELELQNNQQKLLLIEEENRKLDRIINEK
jgi:hypothetical protein